MNNYTLVIIVSFAALIGIGTVFLMMPFATVNGFMTFENALFTATSAVTVTGLVILDTSSYFSTGGQIVLMILIQLGGLGFMTFSIFTILLMSKSVSLKRKSFIENTFTAGNYKNIKDLIKKIIIMTFAIEFTGAVLLYLQFTQLTGGSRVFAAIFHSISAFCNAGFSTFSNNLENFYSHIGINITFMILIILGGAGFLVLNEVFLFFSRRIKSFAKFSLHTKLVIINTIILIIGGGIIIFLEELFNPLNTLPVGTKLLTSVFHSVSARTAGFNTINMNLFSYPSIFLLVILMFIGASPGSTGGGIKTTAFSIVIKYLHSILKGRNKVEIFHRQIPAKTWEKAFIMIIISFIAVAGLFFVLLSFQPGYEFFKLLFEVVSAFGTVGFSLGLTAALTSPAKLIIIITMFIGRIGLLTLLYALSKKESGGDYSYPEENIMIG
jgi:trk system potassium uptake protein TrkH